MSDTATTLLISIIGTTLAFLGFHRAYSIGYKQARFENELNTDLITIVLDLNKKFLKLYQENNFKIDELQGEIERLERGR